MEEDCIVAKINGIDGMTTTELSMEIQKGGRFVVYAYCISIIILAFRRNSDIYFIREGERAFATSWPYTLLTLVVGWWGIPWGPIYSITSLGTNLRGGKDVTASVVASLSAG